MKTKLVGLFSLFLLAITLQASAHSPVTVNEKLLKAFHDAFPQAKTVDWTESGESYFVHFHESATVVSEIEYDHDGNFIESERYYSDINLLPIHLKWEINKKYKDKTVFGITEVNTDTETSYYVKLEDNKEWITVKGTAYGIDSVVEKFQKQP